MVKWFLAGCAAMTLVTACAMGGAKRSAAPASDSRPQTMPSAGGAPDMASPNDARAEIQRLYDEIESSGRDLPPAPEGTPFPDAKPMSVPPLSTDATCKPAKTERCTNACTLSDSICTNAKKICDLAVSLPGDTWAADKCSNAKQQCDVAHEQCCSCQ